MKNCLWLSLNLIVGCIDDAKGTMSVTYNGVSMTSVGSTEDGLSLVKVELFYLVSPATGSNTLTATRSSGSGAFAVHAVSYSGTANTQPDSYNVGANNSSSLTVNTTVVASNCWLVGVWTGNSGSLVAGTGATGRGSATANTGEIGATRIYDSNGTVSTGSQGMTVDMFSGSNGAVIASLKAPMAYQIDPAVTTYSLTSIATVLSFGRQIIMAVGSYTLTSIDAVFALVRKWTPQSKNTSTMTNESKNTSSWTNESKDNSTFTNQTKN